MVRNSWAKIRAIGIAIRARFAESEEASKAILDAYNNDAGQKKLIDEAVKFVDNNLRTAGSEDKATLVPIVEEAAKDLGPAGKLALCDLTAANVNTAADVVASFIHSAIVGTTTHGVSIKCIGSSEENSFEKDEEWPNLFPNNWNQNGNYSFRYEISQNSKRLVVNVKGIVMGDILLITVLPEKEDTPMTVNIKIPDFTTSSTGAINTAVNELDAKGNGLSSIIARAAATQLNELVQNQIVSRLFDKMGIVKNAGKNEGPRVGEERRNNPLRIPRRPMPGRPIPNIPGGIPRPPGPGSGGFPGIGGNDLIPGGGGGGSLFGPGNPSFDEYFNRGRRGENIPGLPPGARFDPYGPGNPPRPRPDGGRGNGRGRRPGEPNPDHLRRPEDDNDDHLYY